MTITRSVHSPKGYLRYMQMSQAVVFAFVEGKEIDPYFYGQICGVICNQRQIAYQLCRANQVPPYAGGKNALLEYHDFLRRQRALRTNLKGKETVAVFFLDKDIDDIERRCRRSRYVTYTRYYDVQNEIFLNGNLSQGCAAAASLNSALLEPLLSDPQGWCEKAAERWQEWVVLCLIAALKDIGQQCNYRVKSQVQCPVTGIVDAARVAQKTIEMAARSRMSTTDFAAFHASVRRRVRRLYSTGQQDKVFKGKWYSAILDEDIKRLMGQYEYDKHGFPSKVTAAVAATLRFADPWVQYYVNRVADVVDNP
jgi:hypothetical protein